VRVIVTLPRMRGEMVEADIRGGERITVYHNQPWQNHGKTGERYVLRHGGDFVCEAQAEEVHRQIRKLVWRE
jgi:hypothetical protein